MKLIVKIEEFEQWERYIDRINSARLEDIILQDKNGNIVDMPKETIDDHKFIGLNNTDYFSCEMYKGIRGF